MDEIKLGETYLVQTPQRMTDPQGFREGERFDLTVTEVGLRPDNVPAVRGLRIGDRYFVTFELTTEQKVQLGLPLGEGRYFIHGGLFDERGGPIERPFPEAEEVTVPARWLQSTAGGESRG